MAPSEAASPGTPAGSDAAGAPSPVPTTTDSNAATSTAPILIGLLAVVALIALGVVMSRRRTKAAGVEDDE